MESGDGPGQATATAGSAHARDLGYLDKFLEKLKSQAAAMPRGDARTRLEALLNEEADRWREIATLLGTGPGAAPATTPRPSPQRPVATQTTAAPREWKPRVTIGSLKRSPG